MVAFELTIGGNSRLVTDLMPASLHSYKSSAPFAFSFTSLGQSRELFSASRNLRSAFLQPPTPAIRKYYSPMNLQGTILSRIGCSCAHSSTQSLMTCPLGTLTSASVSTALQRSPFFRSFCIYVVGLILLRLALPPLLRRLHSESPFPPGMTVLLFSSTICSVIKDYDGANVVRSLNSIVTFFYTCWFMRKYVPFYKDLVLSSNDDVASIFAKIKSTQGLDLANDKFTVHILREIIGDARPNEIVKVKLHVQFDSPMWRWTRSVFEEAKEGQVKLDIGTCLLLEVGTFLIELISKSFYKKELKLMAGIQVWVHAFPWFTRKRTVNLVIGQGAFDRVIEVEAKGEVAGPWVGLKLTPKGWRLFYQE